MRKKNIMLVDDDKIFNFLSEKTITSLGLANEIHFALNGRQALELLEEYKRGNVQRPDIIFLDLNMPVMDGWEFLSEFIKIKNNFNKKITLYVVSSSIDPRDLERAKSFNMGTDYLIKPIELKKFEKIFDREVA